MREVDAILHDETKSILSTPKCFRIPSDSNEIIELSDDDSFQQSNGAQSKSEGQSSDEVLFLI